MIIVMNTNLPNKARYVRALEVIKNSPTPLTKPQIEKEARICPFNGERWMRFQTIFQDQIVVHPINKKVYFIGINN